MHLLIDVGNTRIKWLLHEAMEGHFGKACYGSLEELNIYLNQLIVEDITVLVSAVNQSEELAELLNSFSFCSVIYAKSSSNQAGLVNSYLQPERMGVDRWLAMIAAYNLHQLAGETTGVITVDAGSALTIDVVAKDGMHLGGYIVPGLMMSQSALFTNTDQVIKYDEALIRVDPNDKLIKLGNNTLECVEYGVINQMVALIQTVVNQYTDYKLVFTGGDGEMLAEYFTTAQVDNNLVLKGLWQVRN